MTAEHQGAVAVRAYAPGERPRRPRKPATTHSDLLLVLDCETTTDESQRLLFGSYRVYRRRRLIQEGLIHPDDIESDDLANLQAYVDAHAADNGGQLRLVSRSDFVDEVLWQIGYVGRGLIVGFNLAFDLSRQAVSHTRARNGGFSFALWQSRSPDGSVHTHMYRPNLTVKHLGTKRQFISFTNPARIDQHNLADGRPYKGRFLDLRMAAFALTDKGHSLASAGAEFGVEVRKGEVEVHGAITPAYIDYNRQDVRVTWALSEAIQKEWKRHELKEPVEALYSGASVGKAYLRAMGIRPLRDKAAGISDAALGHHMTAYYGGRTECRIRRTPVPVRYLDVTSMYPTVFGLLGLWRYVTSAGLAAVDATGEARDVLANASREALHDPVFWPRLACVVCRIKPGGDLLPVRARYGGEDVGAWTIGLNELVAEHETWYTLADLVAARLLSGRAPEIIHARRVVARGTQPGLRGVKLGGAVAIDPATQDFFRVVIEARQRAKHDPKLPGEERARLERFLKVLANSTSYGVFAEVRVGEPVTGGRRVTAFGLTELHANVHSPEEPGLFLFPPLAATITGAARLLLAVIEADVAAMGGAYAGCDTDAMLVVASPDGGLVPCVGGPHRLPDGREAILALSDAQVDELREAINRLNPYDRSAVPNLLKLEPQNFAADDPDRRIELIAMQISSKRYALYERTPDGIRLRDWSEHGLGLYRSPIDADAKSWYRETWERLVREVEGLLASGEPDWFNRPAVSQLAISTPGLLAPFRAMNAELPYEQQVRPFNFLIAGHAHPLAPLPDGFEYGHVTPVAPYTSEASRYLSQPWRNRRDGRPIEVTTRPGGRPGTVRLKTYRDVVDEYRLHPESKSGDPAGGPARLATVGLLPRLRVRASEIRHIGKESNRFDEVEEGLITDPEEVYVEYRDERWEWELALARLQQLGVSELAARTGVPVRTLRSYLREGRVPRSDRRSKLLAMLQSRDRFAT